MTITDTAKKFARDTAHHQMTILHDEDLYRHIRFANPKSSLYWFELVTSPGQLVFSGDIPSFAFRRTSDMFEFFRAQTGEFDPYYWAEKVVAGRDEIQDFDREVFQATVREEFKEAVDAGDIDQDRVAAAEADLAENVLDDWYSESEDLAREAVSQWSFDGFSFTDTYEWDFQVWSYPYLWACHAITWGINRYDHARVPVAA